MSTAVDSDKPVIFVKQTEAFTRVMRTGMKNLIFM